MDIFHKLHEEQGKTIVLITHSNELASETERIITLGVSQKSTSETSTADGRVFMGFSRGSTMDDED